MSMETQLVDALPYIDQGYDEAGVREAAISMVEDECRRYRPTKNYLESLPPLNLSSFETPAMRTELDRLQSRAPMETLSMKRYELPPPPAGRLNEPQAWSECVENSFAQLEHQKTRMINLKLALQYAPAAWRKYLKTIEHMEAQAQKTLKDLKAQLHDVNWQRKTLQTRGGEQLRRLEANWVSLVSQNYELEQVCSQLEEELNQLKQLKEREQANRNENVTIPDAQVVPEFEGSVESPDEEDVPGNGSNEECESSDGNDESDENREMDQELPREVVDDGDS